MEVGLLFAVRAIRHNFVLALPKTACRSLNVNGVSDLSAHNAALTSSTLIGAVGNPDIVVKVASPSLSPRYENY